MTYLRTGLTLTAALTLSVSAWTSPVFGQEGPARQGTLTFSQGLEYSDNIDLSVGGESGATSRTTLGLSLSSETRTESLVFDLSAEIVGDFGGSSSDDFDLENTLAAFQYDREGANSTLSFSASYSEVFLDDSVFLSGDSLVIDTGEVDATVVALGFETGLEGPFGLELDARYSDRDYRNTSDPDLADVETASLDAIAHFRINPAMSWRALAGISTEDEADALSTQSDTTYFGFGIEGESGGGFSYFGDVIYDRSETSTSAPSTSTEDGLGIELGLSQERANGALGLSMSSRIDDAGRRSEAEVNRSFEFPTGAVEFSLGVVDQEGDDSLRMTGGFDYSREIANGDITASLSQVATTDSGTPYLNTSLALNLRQEINANSGWEAGLEYFESNQLGGTDDDTHGVATLAYTRDLTADWNMRTGIEHTRVTETGASDRSSNTVFFNIERDITFGF